MPAAPVTRSAPFSMHARGVQLLDINRLLDVPHQLKAAFRHLRDVSSALYTFLLIQTWLSIYSLVITIVSVSFYTYFKDGRVAAPQDWTLAAFVILLPLLGFVLWAFARRERALRDLAEVKSLLLHIHLAHRDWVPAGSVDAMHQLTVQQHLFGLIDALRTYFLPPRFYTRHYPLGGVKGKMMKIAQERAKAVRRITAAFKKLSSAGLAMQKGGLAAVQTARLHELNLQLQFAFERMATIKEYRTPQGIRSMARFYVVLFIPLFFGPYYAELSKSASFGFTLIFACLLDLAMVGLLNVSLALEDPFDNQGLDGVYVDEALFEAEQAIAMDEDAELSATGQSGEHAIRGMAAATPSGAVMMPSDGLQGSASPMNIKDGMAATPPTAEVVARTDDGSMRGPTSV
ncbi:hypothetical protein WJX72_003856 [[Myrmecia] bisecta]|uniref:Gustatory receptor n=1 Tax=[Myrmecia] bisecta TaxID=41462 RepID=A0AAW1PPM2_9CHLO